MKNTLKIVGKPTPMDDHCSYPDPQCSNLIIDIVVEGTYGDITFKPDCTIALDIKKNGCIINIPADYVYGDYEITGSSVEEFWDHPTKWGETEKAINEVIENTTTIEALEALVEEQVDMDNDYVEGEDEDYIDHSDRDDWVPGLGVYMSDGEYTKNPWW